MNFEEFLNESNLVNTKDVRNHLKDHGVKNHSGVITNSITASGRRVKLSYGSRGPSSEELENVSLAMKKAGAHTVEHHKPIKEDPGTEHAIVGKWISK